MMKSIAQKVVNKNIEMKEIIYQYSSVGGDPTSYSTSPTSVSFASVGYDSSAKIAALARTITQGVTDDARVGNKISLRGVYVNFIVTCASTTEPNLFRLALISPKGSYTKQTTGALAYQITSAITTSSNQVLQPIDTDYFKVYWDKTMHLVPYSTYDANYVKYYKFRKFVKFPKGKVIQWSQGQNEPFRDVFLFAVSDSAIASNPGAIQGTVKLYFKDA